jgi:hypothetical protein
MINQRRLAYASRLFLFNLCEFGSISHVLWDTQARAQFIFWRNNFSPPQTINIVINSECPYTAGQVAEVQCSSSP